MPYVGYDEPFRVLQPGERVTMTQFPPLYPALLATTRWLGMEALTGARVLGAASFALTGAVVTAFVGARSRSLWPMALAGALLSTADLVIVHSMVWSETVMLTAFVGALTFATRYSEGRRRADLVAAGVCAVIASGARFVGLAAAVAVVLGILVTSDGTWLRRGARATLFGALCVLPTAAWFVRNTAILGTPSEKEIGWYLLGTTHVVQALSTFGGWVIPWVTLTSFVGAALCVGTVGLAARRLRVGAEPSSSATNVCISFGLCYLAFVLLSRTVLDQNIALDFRILSPLYVIVVIAICINVERFGRVAATMLVLVALGAVARGAFTMTSFSSSSVAAYTGENWISSPTLRQAAKLPQETYLITNAPDPIWIWHDRVAQIIPPRSSLYSGEPNEQYDRDVAAIRSATRCRRAVVVFFDQPTRKPRRYIEPLLVRGLGLGDKRRFADGETYEVTEPLCPSEDDDV